MPVMMSSDVAFELRVRLSTGGAGEQCEALHVVRHDEIAPAGSGIGARAGDEREPRDAPSDTERWVRDRATMSIA